MSYEFFPMNVRNQLPDIGATEGEEDLLMIAKWFTPDSNWTWFASEFDGANLFFGWVDGFEQELGYFTLAELMEARGPHGLPIERDIDFEPTRLSEVKRMHSRQPNSPSLEPDQEFTSTQDAKAAGISSAFPMKFVLRAVRYDIIKLKPGGKLSGGDILKLSEVFARQFEAERQRYSRQAAL